MPVVRLKPLNPESSTLQNTVQKLHILTNKAKNGITVMLNKGQELLEPWDDMDHF